jgi:hypothetical protein
MTLATTTIGIRDKRVVLFNREARLALAFSWRAAIEVAHAMMWKARGIEAPDSHEVAAVRVRRDEESIVLEALTGTLFAIWPLSYAYSIGEILLAKAHDLETHEKAQQIAFDQAILFRRGMKFGVTSDPHLQRKAGQLAAWSSRLRRYLPGGLPSQEQFGVPAVVRGPTQFTKKEIRILRTLGGSNGKH